MSKLAGTILFTVIEVITLVVWLILARNGETIPSVVVLAVGLFLEHYVSVQVGAGKPWFGKLE